MVTKALSAALVTDRPHNSDSKRQQKLKSNKKCPQKESSAVLDFMQSALFPNRGAQAGTRPLRLKLRLANHPLNAVEV